MTLEQIKQSLSKGQKVYWSNENYQVIKDSIRQYLIHCVVNNTYVGLTHKKGYLIEEEKEFFTK